MSAEPIRAGDAAPATTDTSSSLSKTAVDLRSLGWIRPLAGDYAFHFDRIADLFAGDPRSAHAWRDAIERARRHDRPRAEIAAVLAAQQARRGAPPQARAAAARLADPRTVAVVTGQQAGAFGGPLFTLLKAITAVQLARQTAREHNTEVVPVFWIDAEDHDWDEVASCTVLDPSFQPRTIALHPPEGAGTYPISRLMLDSRVEKTIDELPALLPPTDFTSQTVDLLRAAYQPGVDMSSAFARWLESTLGPHGLAVFESSDPAAKPLAAGVFAREIEAPGKSAALAAEAGARMASRGHQPQVTPAADSVSLFYLDGGRRPIRRDGDRFVIADRTVASADLLKEVKVTPDRFSPNVLLRPVVQDTLFPTISYVAGPSELAYLGQLRGVYEVFGVPMPLMYPRATATLVDSATARFLQKYEVPLADLQPQDEAALNRLLALQLPESVERAMREAHAAVDAGMQKLIEAVPALDPTLAGAARTTLGKIEHDLQGLQSKIIQAAKRRDETLRRQFARAQAQMFPQGQPQERTLSGIYFLNRYGHALVDRLLEELPLELGSHWVLTI